MEYVCKMHNEVNKRLGKQIFPCDIVDKVWGHKDCGCNPLEMLKKHQAEINRQKLESKATKSVNSESISNLGSHKIQHERSDKLHV